MKYGGAKIRSSKQNRIIKQSSMPIETRHQSSVVRSSVSASFVKSRSANFGEAYFLVQSFAVASCPARSLRNFWAISGILHHGIIRIWFGCGNHGARVWRAERGMRTYRGSCGFGSASSDETESKTLRMLHNSRISTSTTLQNRSPHLRAGDHELQMQHDVSKSPEPTEEDYRENKER